MKRFTHEWDPEDHQTNVLSAPAPPPEAAIQMEVESEGFSLVASREGFRWLARLFAEISDSDLEEGWHSHRGRNMGWNEGPPEFTIGLTRDVLP